MKISNVKVDLFNWKNEPWQVGARPPHAGTQALGIVTVETDEGVSGHAFLGSSNKGGDFYVKDLIAFVKPMILGQDPQDIGKLWQMMWKKNREVAVQVIAAVDICLWDINGKIAGLPIHRLLGTVRESVPAYSSSPWHATVEEYVEEALHFQELGWHAHKVHPHGRPRADVEICAAAARGGRPRLHAHARRHVDVPVRGCAARRPRHRGAWTTTGTRTRWWRRTSTIMSSCCGS